MNLTRPAAELWTPWTVRPDPLTGAPARGAADGVVAEAPHAARPHHAPARMDDGPLRERLECELAEFAAASMMFGNQAGTPRFVAIMNGWRS